MSRTYRRKIPSRHFTLYTLEWVLRVYHGEGIPPTRLDRRSKEGKKRIAKYHADQTVRYKEPGPAWFRNMMTERPQRREAKAQLHRYLQGEEFEVILSAKDPLDYWL